MERLYIYSKVYSNSLIILLITNHMIIKITMGCNRSPSAPRQKDPSSVPTGRAPLRNWTWLLGMAVNRGELPLPEASFQARDVVLKLFIYISFPKQTTLCFY